MTDVSFLFTNPRHHLEMMLPVARALRDRGLRCKMVSLAEVRGMATPPLGDLPLVRALPYNLRRDPSVGASIGHPSGSSFWIRELAQRAVGLVLYPRIRLLLGATRVVVVPNDSAFPYRGLIDSLRGRIPVVLLQEGIRFDFPNGDPYGTSGVAALCAWGEGSAEMFRNRGVPPAVIHVTGTPRLDGLSPSGHARDGQALRAKLGVHSKAIAYLSNPIEQQGFGTPTERIALFETFLAESSAALRAHDVHVLVKNHRNERSEEYAEVAARSAVADRVHVLPEDSLFAALAAANAAVVLTSTVGIDAMLFGLPLAALEIPGHGFGFEYVTHDGAIGLRIGSIAAGLEQLLDRGATSGAAAFLARHVHDRGKATQHVADVIARVLAN
jgi:hypothetical protein